MTIIEVFRGGYTGRMLIDGEIYTPSEATRKFLRSTDRSAPSDKMHLP
jgi:hypothetical protein